MFLTLKPKHGGGRLQNVATFRASCSTADKTSATAWLQATETLKAPDEAAYEEFVHVTRALMDKHPVVVKLQEVSRLSEREATIAALFARAQPPNTATPICEFKCRNDLILWRQPVQFPRGFCSSTTGPLMSVFVMEEISHNLIDFLAAEPTSAPILTAILKQLGFALMYLAVRHKMTHGDIGSGNLMLDITSAKTVEYDLGPAFGIHHVNTEGYEPILIDFQRSSTIKNPVADAGPVADEISMSYDIIRRWMKRPHPFSLDHLINRCEEAADLADLVEIVEEI